MRMPQKKKPGDPVLASDWNLLLEAISARTPCPGNGLEFTSSTGGFSYALPPPKGYSPKGQPPFSVIAIEKGGSNYLVTIKEGWVIERRPKTADHPHVKFHMPEYGGKSLDAIPRPQLAMAVNDIAWCRFKTDVTGVLTDEKPTIVIDPELKDGVHYWPPDPESYGGEGDYYVKLFKLILDDGSPYIIVYQQSDIEHWAQLWHGQNTGYGAGIYKEHDEDENIFKFRSVRGDYGIKETQSDDEAQLDFWAENKGDGAPVYVQPMAGGVPDPDPPDGPAEFRSIAGRGYHTGEGDDAGVSEQIRVVCPGPGDPPTLGDLIRVLGNGKVGSLTITKGTEEVRLEWNDGQVTTSGDLSVDVPEDGGGFPGGATGAILIQTGEDTPETLIEAANGAVTDIMDITLHVRTFKVCIDGTPTDIDFLCLTPP